MLDDVFNATDNPQMPPFAVGGWTFSQTNGLIKAELKLMNGNRTPNEIYGSSVWERWNWNGISLGTAGSLAKLGGFEYQATIQPEGRIWRETQGNMIISGKDYNSLCI